MRRIRDYFIGKAFQEALNKNVEYLIDEDLPKVNYLVIKNTMDKSAILFKDNADLEVLQYLSPELEIEINGFNLNDLKLIFKKSVKKITFKNCKLSKTVISVENKISEFDGYELFIEDCIIPQIDFDECFEDAKSIYIKGKKELKLTRDLTVKEMTENIKKEYPEYIAMSDEEKIKLMKEYGYLKIMNAEIVVEDIEDMPYINTLKLENLEITGFELTEEYNAKKCKAVLDNLVIDSCTFNTVPAGKVNVNNIQVVNSEGDVNNILLAAINAKSIDWQNSDIDFKTIFNPKGVAKLKLVIDGVNTSYLSNFKKLETLILLDENIKNIDFVKKIKSLRKLVILKEKLSEEYKQKLKLKKIELVEVENIQSEECKLD